MRVLIVADSAALRTRLIQTLRRDPRVLALCAVPDRRAALQEVADSWASLVVVTHPLADDDALAVARALKRHSAAPRVAIYAIDPDGTLRDAAAQAGIDELVDAGAPAASVVAALAAVARRGRGIGLAGG